MGLSRLDAGALGHVAQHDAPRIDDQSATRRSPVADGQGGIVESDRARPHAHGVALGPEPVRIDTRLRPGDPGARTVRRCDATVERRRQLEDHIGAAGPALVQVGGQLFGDLGRCDPLDDLDATLPQQRQAPTTDVGVRVGHPHHDTGDSGPEDRLGTGSRSALVTARLERRVEGGTLRRRSRRCQGVDLGVGAARWAGCTRPDDDSVGDDHRSDPGVRRRGVAYPGRSGDRLGHEVVVSGGVHGISGPGGDLHCRRGGAPRGAQRR